MRSNEPGSIADCLDTSSTRRDWCPQRTFEAMADRDLSRCEVDEKRRDGEGRKTAHTALIDGADGFGDGRKAANAGCDDRRGSQPVLVRRRFPVRLREGFFGGRQCKDDEPVDLALVLLSEDRIRIEAAFRILND
ncbi:hypothetical protein D3C71_1052680 [compost metagenome]